MSTKSLMADKRVAEVTLNEAGKAATLTLKTPWTFEGSAGPFTLKNVEHGHQIVKGATGGAISRAPRTSAAAKPDLPQTPTGAPTAAMLRDPGSATPSAVAPGTVRETAGIFVYRIKRVSDHHNHEVTGWLRTTHRWPKAWVEAHSQEQLCGHYRNGREDSHHYADASRLWTQADERKARTDGTMGSPWAMESINNGAKE